MTCANRVIDLLFGAALTGLSVLPPAGAQPTRAELVRQADVIFVGTVSMMGKTSFSAVPASQRTLVARVDAVLEKSAVVPLSPGDRVTIEVRDPARFHEGMQATFYTRGWIIGEGIAVREVGHEPMAQAMSATGASEIKREVDQTRSQVNDAQLAARMQAADAVVAGRVVGIQTVTLQPQGARPARVTEHDPEWREAVIQVDSAIKGAQPNERLVVRFPASRDVQWVAAPKFALGQEGTFILKRDEVSGAPKAQLAGAEVQAYTALTSQDVMPRAEAQRALRLFKP
jgi:hypothetical protein